MPKMTFLEAFLRQYECVSPRSEFQRIFSRGFDSPDVFFAAKKQNFLQCLHKAMSPHHLQAQLGNQERPPKVELFFVGVISGKNVGN